MCGIGMSRPCTHQASLLTHTCALLAGIATSLKVLFAAEDFGSGSRQPAQLQLERNEVIAMLNLLERLSASIEVVREMSLQLADGNWEQQHPQGLGAIQDFTHNSLYQSL